MEIGRITFDLPEAPSLSPMPTCKAPAKSAEEMLKKALEFANQGMEDNNHCEYIADDFAEGKFLAYEDMAAHLEMLIKEAKQCVK